MEGEWEWWIDGQGTQRVKENDMPAAVAAIPKAIAILLKNTKGGCRQKNGKPMKGGKCPLKNEESPSEKKPPKKDAKKDMAAADAFIEPIINGFWFYFLLVSLKALHSQSRFFVHWFFVVVLELPLLFP